MPPNAMQAMLQGLYHSTLDFFDLRNPVAPEGLAADSTDSFTSPASNQLDPSGDRRFRGSRGSPSPMRRGLEAQLARSQAEVARLQERCSNLERALKARDAELERLKKATGRGPVILDEQQARSRSSELFMTRTDSLSGSSIVQAVSDINSELIGFSSSAIEMVAFESRTEASAQAMQDTGTRLGPNVVRLLEAWPTGSDPTLVGLVLQAGIATCIARAVSAFALGLPTKTETTLTQGPWLQLPVELLESLLALNLDPATLAPPRLPPGWSSSGSPPSTPTQNGPSRPDSPHLSAVSKRWTLLGGKPTPPPIDPGVFRNVTAIRRLIDEAAELSVRASSGLSAAELSSMRSGSNLNSSYLGFNAWGGNGNGGGRNVAMSAMRIHRLRALAVQKLATAYRADEIASSVMVMQGGTVFDDLAERVLKVDPNDADAQYVHFFHEKIPSRQLAEFTTTQVLDELIERQPQRLEYYRTRGIVHCFRDEFSMATKDFTQALKEARAVRKAKVAHHHNYSEPPQNGKSHGGKGGKRRKGGGKGKQTHQPELGTEELETDRGESDEGLAPHPSTLADAPSPLEPQLLFLRGAAYLQHAVHLIEAAILKLEGVHKFDATLPGGSSGVDLRLSCLDGGIYGGVEVGNPDGPLGSSMSPKSRAYQEIFGIAETGEWRCGNGESEKARDHVVGLIKKSMRDHERFLAHFDTLDAGVNRNGLNIAQKVDMAFRTVEAVRPGGQAPPPSGNKQLLLEDAEGPTTFTTYHPLLVEAHFSILLCYILLGDFTNLLPVFVNTAKTVDGLEGYPVFLPPRSLAQAEFIEVLQRLASGWKIGIAPYFVADSPSRGKEKERARIEEIPDEPTHLEPDNIPPPVSASSSSSSASSPSATRATTPVPPSPHAQALNSLRILLAPVLAHQREREEERNRPKKGAKKAPSINIPLHGPRVDIILAWIAAVHFPALERAAAP
ncbi:CRAL-TRIO-N domain-containing protein [Mycena chlorophos]|uniref:CRAL-TRIO-N domain-containing protein n=1 Tax=Mycena chlorophos TaxID=658473 RepID=A0A8H6THE9_MYCCL|nr:CRAL-TRIO-N domain-containing protein [Mycena chlorophos]